MKKPRDIRIKYNAMDIKFDADLMSRAEAKRLNTWTDKVRIYKDRTELKKNKQAKGRK